MLPRSNFKTPDQVAEEKAKADFNERWNAPPPPRPELVPRVPKKDARLMTKEELAIEWGLSALVRKPCDAPSCIERSRQPDAQEGTPCKHGAGIPAVPLPQ